MNVPAPKLIPISLGFVKVFLLRGTDRHILVDSGVPGSADRILKALNAEGIDPKAISLIIFTHGHVDHIGSAAELKTRTGAPIAIHRGDASALRQEKKAGPPPKVPFYIKLFSKLGPQPKPGSAVEPDILIDDELDLAPYGVQARAIATPGHSAGSISIILPDGQFLIGDLLMGGFINSKKIGWPFIVEDKVQLHRSLKILLDLHPTLLQTAHGGPFTPEQAQKLLG
jgi:glyoxylase-like metal-dependent hydrolase (beta-lactamase superfamily II)